jgi:cytoskeleton protein RodZ
MNARASEAVIEDDAVVASLQQLGNTLRQAREARGISLEEVAARLRLAARVVRDIEAGAFEHLPAATYARGYLRAYANFVGIKAEPLLSAYDQYADQPPEINPYASSPQPQVRATDLPMRVVTYVIAAAILGSAGIWLWQTQKLSSLESLSMPKWGAESGSTTPVTVDTPLQSSVAHADNTAAPSASAVATPAAPPGLPTSTLANVNTGAALAPQTAEVQPTPVPTSNEAPVPSDTAAAATVATSPSASATSTVEAAVAANGMKAVPAQGEIPYATSPATNVSDVAGATAPTGQHVLTFECAEDSWLEVYDSENKRLYYNIAKVGSRVAVQGLLPYHVKVGNSPAVMVNYEGHPLDMTAFTQGSVARFQVTPDGYLAQP